MPVKEVVWKPLHVDEYKAGDRAVRSAGDGYYSPSIIHIGLGKKDTEEKIRQMVGSGKLPPETNASLPYAAADMALILAATGSYEWDVDLRQHEDFRDLFYGPVWRAWQNETLRTPKRRRPEKAEKRGNWNFYLRERVDDTGNVVGELWIPYSKWHVVAETEGGIVTAVKSYTKHSNNYALHFWFEETLPEVAVGLRSYWHHDGLVGCLNLDAYCSPSEAYADSGFRPVRGQLSPIHNVSPIRSSSREGISLPEAAQMLDKIERASIRNVTTIIKTYRDRYGL